ncbi:hypothetical protein FB451DRAFT_1407471 [Mycena latifolia]|nr:hypothetical protein FB451DRAFT_1407471 [Mycena latifolia]
MIHYLNNRTPDSALDDIRWPNSFRTWTAFSATLSTASHAASPESAGIDDVLAAIWRVSSLPTPLSPWELGPNTAVYETVLEILTNACSALPSLTVSVFAMVKSRTLDSLLDLPGRSPLTHRLLPAQTALAIPSEILESEMDDLRPWDLPMNLLRDRIAEAKIALLSEFLERCNSDFTPYRALDTARHIGVVAVRSEIHGTQQVCLANHMRRLLDVGARELLDAVINCGIFDLYAGELDNPAYPPRHAWLDNTTARGQIRDTLSRYLKSAAKASARAEEILRGLERLHSVAIE